MIDVLVADDEQPALDELAFLLRADERVGEVLTASSGAEALRLLTERAVDAAFLDIHMPGLSGLELATALRGLASPPAVVFVTADDAHAVDAFELRALDYLLKPVRTERLRRAVDRIAETERPADADEVLPVTVGSAVRFVHRSDVRWVRAEGDYTRLHTDLDAGHLVRIPISELETRWADAGFVRIHRSYLVRAASVTEVRLAGAEPTVWIDDAALPVSRRLVPLVREALIGRSGP
ncbi:LytTR family DNA-binding domain-containing protein [Microbacterium sp. EYE_5]|uniref:LytR/AlgR family response regulator transcription factor n=1 Tax=unclassified Microbacterium TaxID=2609290 RepID=UPI002006B2EF|nr:MULTISPECIES: LytTR family DNA-binding domain-containing protein [unclassified Microbacterium]MCK6079727.1 LytTR family DNA-binding domain-containing protein [Microbacterium sp. EYE_382]MCK6084998.1 LytTR family DNA-binding domain-containing protein [Microbacterium sp. EYE_384]MCK6122776.1 LytTR family DNA-binding domain-containing protein [Microbacterium sp. EYE_80]MCK6125761.1 LytTR family DNA-binding domain-containing protein [Microbacterium sp. EYE_79]MCK6140682.1 LytTR family DNA-bindi